MQLRWELRGGSGGSGGSITQNRRGYRFDAPDMDPREAGSMCHDVYGDASCGRQPESGAWRQLEMLTPAS